MAPPDDVHPLRRLVLRALVPPAAYAASALAMALVAAPAGDASLLEVRRAEQPVDAVRKLLEKHHCWTEAAPRGDDAVVPGHVVVTRHGDAEPTTRGERAVHAALEQVFAGRDARMVVHGFCP